MPTYEYSCEDCGKRVNIFFLSIKKAQEEAPRCPACGGGKLTRLISRFSTVRASSAGPDQGGDVPGLSELESGDPRSIARWMRKMSDEVGQPIEPEMEGVLDRLESGEDPEKIESEMAGPEDKPGTEGP